MIGRLYLNQKPDTPLLAELASELSERIEECILNGELSQSDLECPDFTIKFLFRGWGKIHWDIIEVPWLQDENIRSDSVLNFLRTIPERMGVSCLGWVEEVLPLSALPSHVVDLLYGNETEQARVTRFFNSGDVPAVRVEVIGANAGDVATLFEKVRNGTADPWGPWVSSGWHYHHLGDMRWELPDLSSVR